MEQLSKELILLKASADPERVNREYKLFEQDPDGYIEWRRDELRDWDFPVYCAINIRITTKDGKTVPFFLNRIQRWLWDKFLTCLIDERAIRWFIDKGRQFGVSTFVAVLYYWLCSLRSSRSAVIISQDQDTVYNFSSRLRAIHDETHDLLASPTKQNRRNAIQFAKPATKIGETAKRRGAGLNSQILFVPATKEALGRSLNLQYIHGSEFAFWEDMGRKKIDPGNKLTALRQAVGELPGTAIILETTPNGKNKAEKIWSDAVAGKNDFEPIFLPWCAYEMYRMPLKSGEVLDLCPTEMISGRETRYGDEVREQRILKKQLREWYPDMVARWGEGWIDKEIMARLNWRRFQIDGPCNGDKRLFRQEYSTLPEDGFEATGKNCFDLTSLELMRRAVEKGGLQGARYVYVHD
jgi:hypothetical protein